MKTTTTIRNPFNDPGWEIWLDKKSENVFLRKIDKGGYSSYYLWDFEFSEGKIKNPRRFGCIYMGEL